MNCLNSGVTDTGPAEDDLPYTILLYGNGPGYKVVDGKRPNLTGVDTSQFISYHTWYKNAMLYSYYHLILNLELNNSIYAFW